MDIQALANLNGFSVSVSHMLPSDEMVSMCDIATKREYSVLTGDKIHCIKVKREIYLSQVKYDELRGYIDKLNGL